MTPATRASFSAIVSRSVFKSALLIKSNGLSGSTRTVDVFQNRSTLSLGPKNHKQTKPAISITKTNNSLSLNPLPSEKSIIIKAEQINKNNKRSSIFSH
jgi:hypothetical protein